MALHKLCDALSPQNLNRSDGLHRRERDSGFTQLNSETLPWPKPRSLTNEEVYALTAYILSLNKLIGENDTMNAQTLPKVRMPNRDGFIVRFPDRTP